MNLTDEEKIKCWDTLVKAFEEDDLEVQDCTHNIWINEIYTVKDLVEFLKEYE